MKRIILIVFVLVLGLTGIGQARLIFEGDIGLAFANGSLSDPIYLVLDNPDAGAITDGGIPGGPAILSESEYHIVKWNIGSNIGVYTVPFVSMTGGSPAYVAPQLNITTGGDPGGAIEFSTYATDADNSVWPTGVNHLVHYPTSQDESIQHMTMDRFWIIDPTGTSAYAASTKPGFTLGLNFDPAELDAIPDPDDMVVQRFNPTVSGSYPNGAWSDYLPAISSLTNLPGVPLHLLTTSTIPGSEFYRAWAISGSASPLPIELLDFSAECIDDRTVELSWSTASEINNDYFSIERSSDGLTWEKIADHIHGAGNSSSQQNYSFSDEYQFRGMIYYRLTQTDFDGSSETFDPIVSDCNVLGFEIVSAYSNEGSEQIMLVVSATHDESFEVELLDLSGKSADFSARVQLYEGLNYLGIDGHDLSCGMYIIKLQSDNELMTRKIFLR